MTQKKKQKKKNGQSRHTLYTYVVPLLVLKTRHLHVHVHVLYNHVHVSGSAFCINIMGRSACMNKHWNGYLYGLRLVIEENLLNIHIQCTCTCKYICTQHSTWPRYRYLLHSMYCNHAVSYHGWNIEWALCSLLCFQLLELSVQVGDLCLCLSLQLVELVLCLAVQLLRITTKVQGTILNHLKPSFNCRVPYFLIMINILVYCFFCSITCITPVNTKHFMVEVHTMCMYSVHILYIMCVFFKTYSGTHNSQNVKAILDNTIHVHAYSYFLFWKYMYIHACVQL